ncbi:MAG: sensor histidine kinase [Paracoccus hibiscisoli]|uniref:sensor histidine kinase n=1 Tax=Paracoccus hibiscisoli TaxID=2023261 RepID=UPI00391DD517
MPQTPSALPPSALHRTSYGRRLVQAFTALAALALLLAWLGWHVLQQAEQHVLRGRIASDIFTTLTSFSQDKAKLRNWSYRRILGQPATAERRDGLIDSMTRHLTLFQALKDQAPPEDQARSRTLTLLQATVAKLDAETQALLPGDAGGALDRFDREFDRVEVTDIPALLEESLHAEQRALDLERQRADDSLRDARRLFVGASASGVALSLMLALWLAARLRQPLRRLDAGLGAYARGDFGHRFDGFRDREFVTLGHQLNAMAAEVVQNRQREAQFRNQLEAAVRDRTRDLTQALDHLAASEGARQQLMADIGHELRTPVTVIRGEAQVALRDPGPGLDRHRQALTRIVDVTRQMGRLIEDLLVFVRDPAGTPAVRPRAIALGTALSPALENAARLAAPRGIGLQADDAVAATRVLADPERLSQAVAALLDNALRYSHDGSRITLRVLPDEDEVALQIRDHGIGIDDRDLPHLFTRGWRGAQARMHRADGLGLGLAIARDLVEMQGGRLSLAAAAGGGTVATLRLPAPDADSGP